MDKTLILEAWARYRPSSKENSPVNKGQLNSKRDIKVIYGEQFVSKLMTGIKQKVYLTKEEKLNGAGDEVVDSQLKKQLNALIIGNNNSPQKNYEEAGEEEEDGNPKIKLNQMAEQDDFFVNRNIPEEEVQLIEDFLDKFIFVGDSSSTSREQIDLNLALKALPSKVDEVNIYRIDLMNFNILQRSLIAF